MAAVAFILSSVLFFLGMAVFMTVFLLVARAVSVLVTRAVRKRRLERDRKDYEDWLLHGKLN